MSIEGSSCVGHQKPGDSELGERRFVPQAKLLVRILFILGALNFLFSLPVNAGYSDWSRAPRPTWECLMALAISSVTVFYPLAPILIWFYSGIAACAVEALRKGGPKASLMPPLLAFPLLLTGWIYTIDVRYWERFNLPPLYGGLVFAVGCNLIFLSTLPGLYYWIKFRLSWRNGGI